MIDRDLWQEVFHVLKKNKTRACLTGFGVFWGIFMLVVMLGAGKGLSNGAFQGLGDFALNSLYIWTRSTTIPYEGFDRGRWWSFTNEDTKALIDNIQEIEVLAPRLNARGGDIEISRDNRSDTFRIMGDTPGYLKIDPLTMVSGRYVNNKDLEEKRKVIVIGQRVCEILFEPHEDPLGDYLKINGIYFKIVGIFKSRRSPNNGGDQQNKSIFMPFTTLQHTNNMGNVVGYYSVLAKPGIPARQVEEKMKKLLARRHRISPEDSLAFGTDNVEEQIREANNLFTGITILSWFVGTLTLLAGVIGTSNIMLVIVKERTKEIGVQRALGATPMRIIRQIVTESIFLNTVAGYTGLVLSVGLVEFVAFILNKTKIEHVFFYNPEVDLKVVTFALAILIISGAFAGLLPARRAVSIKPIDALRSEI
ncbi:MAG: ABC transporter permease [Deltaproteobacteria bacterium]|nr:ABC transporter permease [Deltaproteobacteria bacterium]